MTRARLHAAVSLAVTLIAFTCLPSNGIASGGPVSLSDLAPADEYFGREKLSPLGIRHEVLTLKDDLHHARVHPDVVEHKAEFVEDAIDDWLTRFPHDPWIASAAWQLATLFEELPGDDAREHALVVLALVRDRFAGSPFSTDARNDLARGIGVRPWPHWAGSPPPVHVAVARASPVASRSPAYPASPSPRPTPTVAASPADVNDAQSLVAAVKDANATPDPQRLAYVQALEDRFWALSRDGTDASYARAAWEIASQFERLPGEESRREAIRLLALLVDRYPSQIFGRWALRDLERGVGLLR